MGYRKQQREEYWKEIKNALQTINKKDIIIWATDNNGQIAKPSDDDDKTNGETDSKGIGKWHIDEVNAKGNGEKLEND